VVVEVLLDVLGRTQVTVIHQVVEVLAEVVHNILLVDKMVLLVFLDKETQVVMLKVTFGVVVALEAEAVKVQLVSQEFPAVEQLIQLAELLAVVEELVQKIHLPAIPAVLVVVVLLGLVQVMEVALLEVLILAVAVVVLVEIMELLLMVARELLSLNTSINRSL
jgi:hypothetical protein